MESVKLKIERLKNCKLLPEYKTIGASGMDLSAGIDGEITFKPMERKLVPTGIKIELPMGYEAQIRPRSGLSIKEGLSLINCVGTIDADYRGEVMVPIINLSGEVKTIKSGDRIAQMIIAPVIRANLEVVSSLTDTVRGSGGFGSTGI